MDLTKFIPISVLGASLLGSVHCASMCGGLALSRSGTWKDQMLYHIGRLSGYVVLGAIAGEIGRRVFLTSVSVWVSWISSLLMGFLFIALATRVWRGRSPHFKIIPNQWLIVLNRGRGSYCIGLLTAALPCGWLQSFVLSAVATQSSIQGGFLLFSFWLGTLPALGALPVLIRKVFSPFALHSPRLAALLLLSAGFFGLGVRVLHAPFQISQHERTPDSQAASPVMHSCGHTF